MRCETCGAMFPQGTIHFCSTIPPNAEIEHLRALEDVADELAEQENRSYADFFKERDGYHWRTRAILAEKEVKRLRKTIEWQGQEYPDGKLCFCEMAIGHPSFSEHSEMCKATRRVLYGGK